MENAFYSLLGKIKATNYDSIDGTYEKYKQVQK
jgi:hypothetical protein